MKTQMGEIFNIGDRLKLITLNHHDLQEHRNYILMENPIHKIGDVFTLEEVEEDTLGTWVKLKGFKYMHPISKFQFVNN
jgi:hypothetical protein